MWKHNTWRIWTGFLVGQNWGISMFNHLDNHQNIQLNTETKKKL